MDATEVLFPAGGTEATGTVQRVEPVGGRLAVLTDVTPFHPLDHTWPDQPADRGTLAGQPVADCLTGAIGPDDALLIGADIPARRGDEGWTWVVVHLLDGPGPEVGARVELRVDADFRRSLSAAHTACHLAALALNSATADLWRKDPPRTDSLGSPDLDALAIMESRIEPWRSTDTYRLGKSIRKKGLDTDALLAGLADLAAQTTDRLRQWRATGAPVTIDTGGDRSVAARRTWTCALPEGTATYPCGGTHLASLADLPESLRIEYEPTQDGFVATTVVA